MSTRTDVSKIYEALLSTPGMNEEVKMTLRVTRKNVLFLSKVIERGLLGKEEAERGANVLEFIPEEALQDLKSIAGDILQKAGLTEMNETLNAF